MKIEKIFPHIAICLMLLMAAFLYFKPIVFDGKSLNEHDNVQARGMQTESHKYEQSEHRYINWTNQVFLGMPTYQIYGGYTHNMVKQFCEYAFMFKQPVNTPHVMLFYIMLLAYIGLVFFGIDKWLAAIGALSFALATSNLDLFMAGHSTKLHAMAYMAPAIAGAVVAFRGNILLGGGITAFALAGQIGANHVQIVFYTFLIIGFLGIAFLVDSIIKKKMKTFIQAGIVLSLAAMLGVLSNLALLWTTYEYAAETIRGGSELKTFQLEKEDLAALSPKGLTPEDIQKLQAARLVGEQVKTERIFLGRISEAIGPEKTTAMKADLLSLASSTQQKGLEKDYIFGWSYGIMESFTFMVPHFYGGSSGKYFVDDPNRAGFQLGNSHSAKVMNKFLASIPDPNQSAQISQQLVRMTSQYWGTQPFVGGPVYMGAIICFLFILGLLIVKGPVKWGLASAALFLLVLSWGDNFKTFNYFMVDHFPMYNKFRAVTMALSALEIVVVALGILGLFTFVNYKDSLGAQGKQKGAVVDKIFAALNIPASKMSYLYVALAITLSLCLYVVFYSFSVLVGGNDAMLEQQAKQAPQWGEFLDAIRADRSEAMRSDAIRSIIFILVAGAALWAYAKGIVKQGLIVAAVVGGVAVLDILMVDSRYVNEESFVAKREIATVPPATKADQKILSSENPAAHYRVFDLIGGMRSGGQANNPFSSSEGAYYHKIIGGYHAAKPILIQEFAETYMRGNDILTDNLPLLGMMNVKWIIQSPEIAVETNEALGNAWFIETIDFVETADQELEALDGLSPRGRAVTRKSNADYLKGLSNTPTNGDYIILNSYHPEKLVYKSKAANERFAVFSEIYYPPHKGWNVYIDGKKIDKGFIKVNYLLRGMRVPAGEHTIEMRFEPRSHAMGETIALISSLLIFGFLGFAIWKAVKNPPKKDEEEEAVSEEPTPETPVFNGPITENKVEEQPKTTEKKPKKKK